MSAWIQGLLALMAELVLAWLALTVAPESLRPALLIVILLLGVVVAALILTQRKRGASSRVPRLSTEDRAALRYRLLLGETARRGKSRRRRTAKRFLNRQFREIERQWAVVDVEVAECKPAFYGDAVWTADVSKVETGRHALAPLLQHRAPDEHRVPCGRPAGHEAPITPNGPTRLA